jgi:hypothetical protein
MRSDSISTTLKAIRLGKSLKYELFLLFERFKGFTVKTIFSKLPAGYCSKSTVYNYHTRYQRADRKAKELSKDW